MFMFHPALWIHSIIDFEERLNTMTLDELRQVHSDLIEARDMNVERIVQREYRMSRLDFIREQIKVCERIIPLKVIERMK